MKLSKALNRDRKKYRNKCDRKDTTDSSQVEKIQQKRTDKYISNMRKQKDKTKE